MPTLKMESEVVRSTHSTLVNQHQALTQAVMAMTGAVNNTVNVAWQGNSATEFQSQYEQIRASMIQQLDRLNQLNTTLMNEINQWETAGGALG